jgi:hypothetical protein
MILTTVIISVNNVKGLAFVIKECFLEASTLFRQISMLQSIKISLVINIPAFKPLMQTNQIPAST